MKPQGVNIYILFFAFLLRSGGAEESSNCDRKQNSNGTVFFSVRKTCEDYSWKVNGTIVAHDGDSNKTLVQNYSRSNIVFKTCQTDVTYFCERGMMISCESICPTQPDKTIHEGDVGGGIVAVIVIAVIAPVVVIVGVIVWWMHKKLGRDLVI